MAISEGVHIRLDQARRNQGAPTIREEIAIRAALAELREERQAYISRELYVTKARDKAVAALAEAERERDEAKAAVSQKIVFLKLAHERAERAEADLAAARDVIQFYADEFFDEGERGRAFLERTATAAAATEAAKPTP